MNILNAPKKTGWRYGIYSFVPMMILIYGLVKWHLSMMPKQLSLFLIIDLGRTPMVRKLVKPSHSDPHTSVDLFDADRKNDFGETYCVAPAILDNQVDEHWKWYLKQRIDELIHLISSPSEESPIPLKTYLLIQHEIAEIQTEYLSLPCYPADLKDIPFPKCCNCFAAKYFGVSECESVCPEKFKKETKNEA